MTGPPREISAEHIQETIAVTHGPLPPDDPIVQSLLAAVAARKLPPLLILIWLHDRPAPVLSVRAFELWAQRYFEASGLGPLPPAA